MHETPFDQLDRDWHTHIDDADLRDAYQALRSRFPALAPIQTADRLVAVARRGDGADAIDRVLADLAVAAADGNQHATRIILQALIPGLKLIAVRLHWAADLDTVESTVITTAWERICTYPIGRRPRRVAANIIRDTQTRVRRELQHPREFATNKDGELDGGEVEIDYASAEAADVLRRSVQRGRITRRAAQIIVGTRLHHHTFDELTKATGDNEDVLRRQRERAEKRLRRRVA